MTVCDLKTGQNARIEAIDPGYEHSHRLIDLGFVPGSSITLTGRAPFGGPLLIFIRGRILLLRKSEGARIVVIPEALS